MGKGIATVERSLAVSYKSTYTCHTTQQFNFLVFIPQKWKHVHIKTCATMFIAALSQLPKNGNKPNVLQQVNG